MAATTVFQGANDTFPAKSNGVERTVALGDTPSDFGNATAVTIDVEYSMTGYNNDNFADLDVWIETSGGTLLASNSSSWLNVDSRTSNTGTTTSGTLTFNSINTTADKADWDGAVLRYRQTLGVSMGADSVSYTTTTNTQVDITYNAAAVAYTLDVNSGSVAITGSSVDLTVARKLDVNAGAVALNGSSVDLTVARKLDVNAGAVALNGSSVDLTVARKLDVSAGSLSITGNDVDLTVGAGITHYTLDVNPGAVSLAGGSVELTVARKLDLTTGTISLSGSNVDLTVARKLDVTSGAVSVTGSNVELVVERKLDVSAGAVTVTGNSVDLEVGGAVTHYTLDVESGAVPITGSAVNLVYSGAPVSQIAKINGIDTSTIIYVG